jgi:hypothetical protein
MSTTDASERFTALLDDRTLTATVVALEEHRFSVDVVDDLDAARKSVLARLAWLWGSRTNERAMRPSRARVASAAGSSATRAASP